MDWLNNGSKTLVNCVGIAAITAMAITHTLTDAALTAILGIAAAYNTINVVQNRAPSAPTQPPAA